jgi:hypothetical protein
VLKKTITLVSTRKEGNEVVLTQTVGGATILGAASKTLSGAVKSVPVIRGVLMTPRGIVPTLDLANGTGAANYLGTDKVGLSVSTDIRALNVNGKNCGDSLTNDLVGYELGRVEAGTLGFDLILNGFTNTNEQAVVKCFFDPESQNYFSKVLNTDPEKIEEKGHFLYSFFDIDKSVSTPSFEGLLQQDGSTSATKEMIGFCKANKGNARSEAANSPDFESFDSQFRSSKSPWFMSQSFGAEKYKLFKVCSLDDGNVGNDRFRLLISNIVAGKTSQDYGSFDLSLEAFDSDPVLGEALVQWKNLNLDPDSRNFVGRVIGDKYIEFNFSSKKLEENGIFEVKNNFVRVEVSDDVLNGEVPVTSLPCGFQGMPYLNTNIADLFDERGDNGNGVNLLLQAAAFDKIQTLPLPFVKSVSRKSGSSIEASASLPWGVKFAKRVDVEESHSELSEIRFNESIKSWSKFYPDMFNSSLANSEALSTSDSKVNNFQNGEFSLEKIAVSDAANIDWSTSEYVRSGVAPAGKAFITLNTASSIGKNVRYLKFRCLMQGGFDGVDIFNADKSALNSAAAFREANDESSSSKFTGPTVDTYKKAIDVLADKSATEFQLLAIPGMREPLVTDYASESCQDRFDAMFIMDIHETTASSAVILDSTTKPSVSKTITKFSSRGLDTSFTAAYFPDVFTAKPSNNSPIQVPPSVCMLGVMSQNDTLADPWFAPAGLRRGRLNALNSKVQMNRDTLDSLYDADINPIYEPAGRSGQVYAFGQKTLLQNQSALDRINVRRLLINVRRKVKAIANTLLFEPNRELTLNKFSALVEPIMAEVQARQGVDRYKVQIDTSTTTQNDVENNTIRGKIYLQPTKSVEFISLDFVVTNSID